MSRLFALLLISLVGLAAALLFLGLTRERPPDPARKLAHEARGETTTESDALVAAKEDDERGAKESRRAPDRSPRPGTAPVQLRLRVLDPLGSPAPGARVRAIGAAPHHEGRPSVALLRRDALALAREAGDPRFERRCDERGRCDLPLSEDLVVFAASGPFRGALLATTGLPGGRAIDCTLVLRAPRALHLRVRDGRGRPVAWLPIRLFRSRTAEGKPSSGDSLRVGRTDRHGRLRIDRANLRFLDSWWSASEERRFAVGPDALGLAREPRLVEWKGGAASSVSLEIPQHAAFQLRGLPCPKGTEIVLEDPRSRLGTQTRRVSGRGTVYLRHVGLGLRIRVCAPDRTYQVSGPTEEGKGLAWNLRSR